MKNPGKFNTKAVSHTTASKRNAHPAKKASKPANTSKRAKTVKTAKPAKRLFRIGSFLGIVFLSLYIPSFIHWITGSSTQTDVIRIGFIEDSINIKACIIRNEQVFNAPSNGTLIAAVREGEKIPKGGKVADILMESSVKLLEDLAEANHLLIKAIEEKGDRTDFFSGDLEKVDDQLSDRILSIVKLINMDTVSGTDSIKADIDELLLKKAEISGGFGKDDTYITGLISKKEQINKQIDDNTKQIFSSSAGYVSYKIDGFENLLQPESIVGLGPEELDLIFGKESDTAATQRLEGNKKTVGAGLACAKVITDYCGFILFTLDHQQSGYLEAGDRIRSIRFNDCPLIVDGTVQSVVDGNDGRKAITIMIDKGMESLSTYRIVNADLIRDHYEGLKVPIRSLIDFDSQGDTAFIAIVRNNKAVITKVKVVAKTTDYAIIERMEKSDQDGVNLYDTYVLDPLNIEEGQVIGDE